MVGTNGLLGRGLAFVRAMALKKLANSGACRKRDMIAAVAVMIAGELVLPLYLIISISISSAVSISISIPTFNSTLFRRHCGELATDAIIRGWHNVRLRPRAAATEAKGRRDCGAATAINRHPRQESSLAMDRYCDRFRGIT